MIVRQENRKMQIAHTVYYSELVPEGGGHFPLLIALHGYGLHADRFASFFKPLAERGIIVVAPQAPHHFYLNLQERKVGFTWLTRYQRDQCIADFAAYMNQLYDSLSARVTLDPARVFVLGFSQGVSMAYRLWLHSQVPVRGLIACGADLPPDVASRLSSQAPIPVFLIHGQQDEMVPFRKAEHALASLRDHDYPVDLYDFEGGHQIPLPALKRIAHFMLNTDSSDHAVF